MGDDILMDEEDLDTWDAIDEALLGVVEKYVNDKRGSPALKRSAYPQERLPAQVLVNRVQDAIKAEKQRVKAKTSVQSVNLVAGEPTCLADFGGQEHIIDFLEHAIAAMAEDELKIAPILFTGPPGLGKTTLAKVATQELITRAELLDNPKPDWIEIFPADVPNVAALDDIMVRAYETPGSVIFIDEIHDVKMGDSHWRKLYLFLQEERYKFEGAEHPIKMPPTTVFAATTDDGDLPDALKRRFQVWRFEPATPDQLRTYVRRRPFKISNAALELIIDRLGIEGRPWEVLQCYAQAVVYAKGSGRDIVKLGDVQRAMDNRGIDAYGLGKEDRDVIKALLSTPTRKLPGLPEPVHILSESNIVGITQIHKALYANTIKPRLLKRGFLTIRTGQMLTDKAVQIYGPYFQEGRGSPAP